MRVLHVVVTDHFAGVERYVASVGRHCAARGLSVTVVGGAGPAMRAALGPDVAWYPGRTLGEALASVVRVGRVDICHVHMTQAEVLGLATRVRHRAPVLATRHFAWPRGASRSGRLLAPWIARGLAAEIAISDHVAARIEQPPRWVLPSGVADRALGWSASSRRALMLQRLEPEKDAVTAIRAWHRSGLGVSGWQLRVVGEGSQREPLEALVHEERVPGVEFAGWVEDASGELAQAGMLVAPTGVDGLGLSVLEAMATGIPVVAARGGGHLETVGAVRDAALFEPGDADAAAAVMIDLASDPQRRERLSVASHSLQRAKFSLTGHVEALLAIYDELRVGR